MIRQLPNAITVSRGLCGPLVLLLLLGQLPLPQGWLPNRVAFAMFIFAIITDLLDGWVARRLQAFSPAGLWLDPFADKVLTDCTWAALGLVGFAPMWMCITMIARDVIIIGVWIPILLQRRARRWTPTPSGQVMVAFEGVALSVFLFHGPWLDVHWPTVGATIGAISLALSIVSLLEYATQPREPA